MLSSLHHLQNTGRSKFLYSSVPPKMILVGAVHFVLPSIHTKPQLLGICSNYAHRYSIHIVIQSTITTDDSPEDYRDSVILQIFIPPTTYTPKEGKRVMENFTTLLREIFPHQPLFFRYNPKGIPFTCP